MGTLAVEKQRNLSRGDKKVNGFSGAIRSLEALNLEKGDTFVIPESFEVFEQKIGEGTAQYIFVELANGNAKPFYPSTMTKRRTIYNEDGTSTGEAVFTTGTAAELFRSFGSVQEGMEALKGKKIVVSDVKTVRTLRFGTASLMNAQIPVLDLVD